MDIAIYREGFVRADSFENFLDLYYSRKQKYFASDLLNEGFSPADVNKAIQRAMSIAKSTNLDIRSHFSPIYTQAGNELIRDCKLTRLGYGMVLLNAPPDLKAVGELQLKVLKRFFEKEKYI